MAHLRGEFCFQIPKNMAQNDDGKLPVWIRLTLTGSPAGM